MREIYFDRVREESFNRERLVREIESLERERHELAVQLGNVDAQLVQKRHDLAHLGETYWEN